MGIRNAARQAYRRILAARAERHAAPSRITEPDEPREFADGALYTMPPVWTSPHAPTEQQLGELFENTYGTPYSPGSWAHTQFGNPFNTGPANAPYVIPTDHPLREWNTQMRWRVAVNTHSAVQRNPLAKRAVNVTRQFVVGRGHTVSCLNKDVERIINEFRANPENNVNGYDKTFVQDLMIDGELFIRHQSTEGRTVIVPLKPWRVIGINADPDFFRRVNFYRYQTVTADYQLRDSSGAQPGADRPGNIEIPADQIVHVAINNHSYELRGRSDLFSVLVWLKGYNNWLEERARQNKWRGAVIWWVKILSRAGNIVASKAAQYRKPPKSGSVWVTSENEEVSALNNPVGANDAAEDGRQIRLMIANGVDLPEYMLADGENANLATANAQELPALWKFTDGQEIMKEQVWTPIYRTVLQNAIDAGLLKSEVEVQDSDGDPKLDSNGQTQTVDTLEAFEVRFYELQADDPKTLQEALGLALSNEIVSRQGAQEVSAPTFGLDPNTEAKRIDAEREKMRNEAAQGLRQPYPQAPVMDDEDADDGPPDTTTE